MAGRPQRPAILAAAELEPTARRHGDDCSCVRCTGTQPGNTLATTHGSYRSDLALSTDPHVAELAERIAATQPITHPADAGACWRLALAYKRVELSAAALDAADRELAGAPLAAYRDGADFLMRLREDHARWLRLAGRIEEELGRSPLSRSRLALDIAATERTLSLVEYWRGRRPDSERDRR